MKNNIRIIVGVQFALYIDVILKIYFEIAPNISPFRFPYSYIIPLYHNIITYIGFGVIIMLISRIYLDRKMLRILILLVILNIVVIILSMTVIPSLYYCSYIIIFEGYLLSAIIYVIGKNKKTK